ncbi:MAG: Lrp/AsnC family transcriptional regulator [Rhodospirillales bacterium]|nr:Lrp/AsnC family transcriptional regulator [Rhodospirillales bacterium]
MVDETDRRLLRLLAHDASLPLSDIAAAVGLSPTPCWKRIRRLEQLGVIRRRVAELDPAKIGLTVSVIVAIETADHSAAWLERFAGVIDAMPEVVQAWRMSGDVDYILHVVLADLPAYDDFYRRLIEAVPLRNVTSRFVMERMKSSPLPI